MKVFKFGGASVKNAAAICNVASIVQNYNQEKLVIIVSAMGKTTNHLESLLNAINEKNESEFNFQLNTLKEFHAQIIRELFTEQAEIHVFVESIFNEIQNKFKLTLSKNFSFEYDQIVSLGEVISSYIITEFLKKNGQKAVWADSRILVRTDSHFQEANVDWLTTESLIKTHCDKCFDSNNIIVTQGFIGHDTDGFTTTLGREGSDYSAAIYAFAMNAQDVTIWKDVPGMLNADPKFFEDTQLLSKISYKEAIELAYFGASVIHPKTIKPLQNKNIPLYIKSFIEPEKEGTSIQSDEVMDHLIPSFIFKKDQLLVSISTLDFSFINEDALATIFEIFYSERIKINLMQNSALSFSVLLDASKVNLETLSKRFHTAFQFKYNENVELVTIRHYDESTISKITRDREVLIEQRTRQTARFVLR